MAHWPRFYFSSVQFTFFALIVCPPGSSGFDCLNKCNTYCTGNELCNYMTGICDEGCKEGWDGPLCTTGKTKFLSVYIRSEIHYI